jgi:hypothetical protein
MAQERARQQRVPDGKIKAAPAAGRTRLGGMDDFGVR